MEVLQSFTWWQNLLLVLAGLFVLLTILSLPRALFRLLGRLLLNCAAALAVLLLINLTSSYSGVVLPVNGVTLGVGGVLGAPGILALALASSVV